LYYLILAAFCGLLLYASTGLPPRGDHDSPANRVESPAGSPGAGAYYIGHAKKDADAPNLVTVVLADYRSFDTLGETLVVFAAGVVCWLVLRRNP
jgi:multicomponent Na+:H+ antiporter subunit B